MSVVKFSGKSRFKLRCDTAAEWERVNPVLYDGEIGIETAENGGKRIKIGDGVTAWRGLGYAVDGEISADSDNPISNRAVAKALAQIDGKLTETLQDISDALDTVV